MPKQGSLPAVKDDVIALLDTHTHTMDKVSVILEVYSQNPGRPFQSKQDKMKKLENAEEEEKPEGLGTGVNGTVRPTLEIMVQREASSPQRNDGISKIFMQRNR